MKNITLLILCFFTFFQSCKKDDGPKEKRFLDKIEITKAKLSGWDVLSGPDLQVAYDNGEGSSGQSEIIDEVAPIMLPVTFDQLGFELTGYMSFKLIDVDEYVADEIMYSVQFNPYVASEEGNPFAIGDSEYTIKVYWRTQ